MNWRVVSGYALALVVVAIDAVAVFVIVHRTVLS